MPHTVPAIEVAVATMEETDPPALVRRLGLDRAEVGVLIINQVSGTPPPAYEAGGVRMVSYAERGLSRSRNRALSLCRADIMLVADDDIHYLPGFEAAVRRAFEAAPGAAAITFQKLDAHSGQPSRRYPARAAVHHPLSVAGVNSVEVALRPARLSGLRFDERFGLGAAFKNGEEAIFLADALRRGLEVRYVPEALCSHQGPSSGHLPWDRRMLHAKGAALRRLYPATWPLWLLGFGLLKRDRRPVDVSAFTWWAALWAGARSLPRTAPVPDRL